MAALASKAVDVVKNVVGSVGEAVGVKEVARLKEDDAPVQVAAAPDLAPAGAASAELAPADAPVEKPEPAKPLSLESTTTATTLTPLEAKQAQEADLAAESLRTARGRATTLAAGGNTAADDQLKRGTVKARQRMAASRSLLG